MTDPTHTGPEKDMNTFVEYVLPRLLNGDGDRDVVKEILTNIMLGGVAAGKNITHGWLAKLLLEFEENLDNEPETTDTRVCPRVDDRVQKPCRHGIGCILWGCKYPHGPGRKEECPNGIKCADEECTLIHPRGHWKVQKRGGPGPVGRGRGGRGRGGRGRGGPGPGGRGRGGPGPGGRGRGGRGRGGRGRGGPGPDGPSRGVDSHDSDDHNDASDDASDDATNQGGYDDTTSDDE